MATTYKTSSRTKRPVVVSVPLTRDSGSFSAEQTEAARIEAYLLREGFKPVSAKEKARLKRAGFLGMPEE